MIKVSLAIPKDVFDELRSLPSRSRRRFNTKVKEEVQPAVQKNVTELLGEDPGPVKYPFEFATAKSRRFYFWAFKGQIPYKRTGAIQRGWSVLITRSGEKSYIEIFNKDDAAQYVYGDLPRQRQVTGHKNTGWAKDQ